LGTLCVIDRVPRSLDAEQRGALEALRRQAVAQLELRRNLLDLERALVERDRAETGQARLIAELQVAFDNVKKLSALVPFCSACELNMVIPADPVAIPTVADGVMQLLRNKHWDEDKLFEVEIALQEALANAIRHGCGSDSTKKIQCCLTCDSTGEVMVVVRDPGTGFDPGAVPSPLEAGNLMKAGGRGIFLINELMDDVRFEDGGREIRMRKRGRE
jgi:serine/threonine-protein kinase RsbW